MFHVDAAQATGKVAIDLKKLKVDLMALTAHKTYGPKGIGALYVSRESRVKLDPQMHGGGHERGLRSGTLATHQIVGMGAAAEILIKEREAEQTRLATLMTRLEAALADITVGTPAVWVQEEPENMGPWSFVEQRIWRLKAEGYDLRHVARVESGSPATGSKAIHDQELAELLQMTFAGL